MLLRTEEIKVSAGDSPEFIRMMNKIISTLVFQYGINDLYYVRIKNWFDHKWLNFSGNAVVPFESGGILKIDAALEDKWQDKITVPPFSPKRVLLETFVVRDGSDNNMLENFGLHKPRSSNDNLHNRISRYSENGLFIWYSSNTKANEKGSVMIYRVQKNEVHSFYATLEQHHGQWQVTRSKGIELNELKLLTSSITP
jgi:hypothetical protein